MPNRLRAGILWVRQPSRKILRLTIALLLIFGSFLAILPIFGMWMLPVGLALLADDVPGLKPSLERTSRWVGGVCGRVGDWWRRRRSGSTPGV